MDTTIKDIAEQAGLSYSTVSRALNGKYGVRKETREKIRALAEEMRYRPNAIARGLINKKTDTIGLIIPDLRNPFFPEVAAGIEAAAEEAGYSVFLCVSDWATEREDRYLTLLIERRVDGIIIAPVRREDGGEPPELTGQISAVYVSSMPASPTYPYVAIDNRCGGFLATSHLIERNRTPVAFIGAAAGSDTGEQRREGYSDALKLHGYVYDPALVKLGHFSHSDAADAARELVSSESPPGGIFAENDDLALAVIETLSSDGYSIPEDIGVIGFDDISLARMHGLELSTVAQPIHNMGSTAVELLLEQINGEQKPARVLLQPELIQRGTT